MSVFPFGYMLFMHKIALKWKAAFNLEEEKKFKWRGGKKKKVTFYLFPNSKTGVTTPDDPNFFQNQHP